MSEEPNNSGEGGSSQTLLGGGEGQPPEGEPQEPQIPEFQTLLPEDLRGDETLGRFKDTGALAKSYLELRKMQGAQVTIPAEDASQDDWAKFYDKFRPSTPEDYELPQGPVELQEDMQRWFRQTAHDLGLSPKQATQLFGSYTTLLNEIQTEADQEIVTAREASMKALNAEWGAEAQSRITAADQFGSRVLSQDTWKALKATGMADNAHFVKDLYALSEKMAGGSLSNAAGDQTPGLDDQKAAAKKRLDEIYSNMHQYYQKPALVEEATRLEKLLEET
jgi:hypothetical protein